MSDYLWVGAPPSTNQAGADGGWRRRPLVELWRGI